MGAHSRRSRRAGAGADRRLRTPTPVAHPSSAPRPRSPGCARRRTRASSRSRDVSSAPGLRPRSAPHVVTVTTYTQFPPKGTPHLRTRGASRARSRGGRASSRSHPSSPSQVREVEGLGRVAHAADPGHRPPSFGLRAIRETWSESGLSPLPFARSPVQRSSRLRPVLLAICASIRGPISSRSWKAKGNGGQPSRTRSL